VIDFVDFVIVVCVGFAIGYVAGWLLGGLFILGVNIKDRWSR
jgi:uncharacterized membrane protein YciS (DUF1049 family)